ncbi:hypothetical protein [Streptosporangium sp. NPDC049644]|uniref:hypothetical protein n=1 Tax=Streptosporangium sp. NPDC049644 TaxID=3155507 RepID=UPI00342D2B61
MFDCRSQTLMRRRPVAVGGVRLLFADMHPNLRRMEPVSWTQAIGGIKGSGDVSLTSPRSTDPT